MTIEQKVETLFEDYSGENAPGAAVMVVKQGQPVLIKTYGMANLEQKIPVTPHTNFRLASMTKQFTSMCIMMLVEQGKITYDTSLREVFPDFPEYGNHITLRHLLQHTSGLIDYEELVTDTLPYQITDREILQLMKEQDSTYFEPGSEYRYSNTGYAVLAISVEEVSGLTFANFLKKYIFESLGMKNTVAYQKGISTVFQRAYGYTVLPDSVLSSDQSVTSAVLGDGGIYSSIDDLFKWDQALYTEQLVSRETLALAYTPHLEIYGFGWRIDEYKGHQRIHHTGSTRGFRTIIQRFPKDQFSVIILTNRNDPDVAPLAEELTDLYLLSE
ncbi:MAG: beta-lactamase family protein [bacterium]|nr:MAG: beta-lactamase family protein [bacterium]